jgi:hypothetical protein
VFRLPGSLGLDHRVLNGYVYVSPTVITDNEEIQRRAAELHERARYYFEHWDELHENWVGKAEGCRARLKAVTFDPLPEVEPLEVVTGGRQRTRGYRLMEGYDTLLQNVHEEAYLHFKMLGLGYGAFLTSRDFCATAFASSAASHSAPRGAAPTGGRPGTQAVSDVTASVTIDAPEAVFPYLVEAEFLTQWLGTWAELRPEPGGIFAVGVGSNPARETYIEVEPATPRRVHLGRARQRDGPARLLDRRDRPDPGRRADARGADPPRAASRALHERGWTQSLGAAAHRRYAEPSATTVREPMPPIRTATAPAPVPPRPPRPQGAG